MSTSTDEGGLTDEILMSNWKHGDTQFSFKEWVEAEFPVVDRFGARWPDHYDLCPECKQPDNCGDCNHQPLTTEQVWWLAGVPPS